MILFSSFKPKIGAIQKISVYYSQYGKEKLEEEERQGPTNIWN